MNSSLVSESIALIRRAERLALAMQPELGFHVAFSGGKDSQVVLELTKMAGVRFHVVYNVTTNDPAENVRFIKRNYSEVEFNVPLESYLRLIERKGLPIRKYRWCCALFKESSGVGSVVLTGVRAEESSRRAKYAPISRRSIKKDEWNDVDIDKMEANEFRCVGGRDKFLVYPIINWTEADVWRFIGERKLPVNPVYSLSSRVGCVFCPFAKPKNIKEYCESHPKLYRVLLQSIDKFIQRKGERFVFSSSVDYFDWWLSRKSLKEFIESRRQMSLFECSTPLGAKPSMSQW